MYFEFPQEKPLSDLNDFSTQLGFAMEYDRMQRAKMRGKKKENAKPPRPASAVKPKQKKMFSSFFKRKVKPVVNPVDPQPIPEVNPAPGVHPPPVENQYAVSAKAQANAKHIVDSIKALGPEQLGLLPEDDENYDEAAAFSKVEEIGRNPMKFIYVAHVLHWWVHSFPIFTLNVLRLVICYS